MDRDILNFNDMINIGLYRKYLEETYKKGYENSKSAIHKQAYLTMLDNLDTEVWAYVDYLFNLIPKLVDHIQDMLTTYLDRAIVEYRPKLRQMLSIIRDISETIKSRYNELQHFKCEIVCMNLGGSVHYSFINMIELYKSITLNGCNTLEAHRQDTPQDRIHSLYRRQVIDNKQIITKSKNVSQSDPSQIFDYIADRSFCMYFEIVDRLKNAH